MKVNNPKRKIKAADSQAVLELDQLSTGDILNLLDSSNSVFRVADGGGIYLPTTSAAGLGTVYKNSVRYLHDYVPAGSNGNNLFFGPSAGNFTMAISGQAYHCQENTGIGSLALSGLTTGYNNLAFGANALRYLTTGQYNVAVGPSAMGATACTTTQWGTAFGANAMASATGAYNTGLGRFSLQYQTGQYNLAVGFDTGRLIADGNNFTTGTRCVYIGPEVRASANSVTNEIAIGDQAIGGGSNSITLGSSAVTKTFLQGNVGIGVTPTKKLHIVDSLTTNNQTVYVSTTSTMTSGFSNNAAYFLNSSNPATNSSAEIMGLQGIARVLSGNTRNHTGSISGLSFTGTHDGTGTVSNLFGMTLSNTMSSTGTVTNGTGAYVGLATTAGRMTTWYGFRLAAPSLGSAKITTSYGLHIASQAATGSSTKNISTIVGVGGTVTVVTTAAHNFFTGDNCVVAGTTNYNGTYAITVVDTTTFTFSKAGDIAQETTGTVAVSGVITNTPYGIYQAGSSDANFFNGRVGIGTTAGITGTAPYTNFSLAPLVTDHNSSEYYVQNTYPTWRPTNDVAKSFYGAIFDINVDGAGNPVGNLTGSYFGARFNLQNRLDSPTTMASAVGGYFRVYNGIGGHSGTITSAFAGRFVLQNDSTSSMTNGVGVSIVSPTGTGTIANLKGIEIGNMSVGTTTNYAIITNAGNIVFNEGGDANTDFRVEGDTDANLLFTDASADKVGVGTGAPTAKLSVSEKCAMNAEGGFMIKLTNRTGTTTVKGSVVRIDTANDNSFILAPADSDEPIGVVYENGVADGSEAWVVTQGRAQVLLENSTASTRGNWVRTSATTAGRADATSADPTGVVVDHMKEIGHCTESKTAGTDVLAWCVLHFN